MKFIITKTDKGEYADDTGNRYGISEVKPGTVALGPGVQDASSLAAALTVRGLTKAPAKTTSGRPVPVITRAKLQAKRDAIQFGAFAFMGKRIQYDMESRTNIAQAVRNAMVATDEQWPTGFAWICEDNSWLPLTRQQILAMDVAAGQFLAACFAVFAQKTSQIEAGEPCEINTGWPE